MFIVTKKPGKPPEARWVKDRLETFQKIVKGPIEQIHMRLPGGLQLWANEEGMIMDLQRNIQIQTHFIVGPCYIRNEKGMDASQIEWAGSWLERFAVENIPENCHFCNQPPRQCIGLPECEEQWKKRAITAEEKLREIRKNEAKQRTN